MVQRLAVQPGADLSVVRLRAEGADAVALDEDVLHLSTAAGEVAVPLLLTPGASTAAAVQPQGAQVFDVTAPFTLSPPRRQSKIENPQSPADNLTDLLYGTFLGGSDYDYGYGIAADGAGNAYVTGLTRSSNFPTTPGAFDPSFNGGDDDAFVAKLNPAGSGLVYATFVGGSDGDRGCGIALDSAGSAFVTGWTESSDFPTTSGAFDTSHNNVDAFVVKLNPVGSGLAYATFVGGSYVDYGLGIAVDGAGSAYVVGSTASEDFPTTLGAFDRSYNDWCSWCYDAFVVKLNAIGVFDNIKVGQGR